VGKTIVTIVTDLWNVAACERVFLRVSLYSEFVRASGEEMLNKNVEENHELIQPIHQND